MRTKNFRKVFLAILASLMCMMVVSVTAFAEAAQGGNTDLSSYFSGVESLQKIPTAIKNAGSIEQYSDLNTLNAKANSAQYSYYYGKDSKVLFAVDTSKETNIAQAISDYNQKQQQKSENMDKANTQITDMKTGLDITADTDTAVRAVSGFIPVISTILGILVILITVGMTIFSAFDLAFIAFPIFREKCEDAKVNGNRMMTKTNKQTGESKLRFVSDDAQYAVAAADTTQSGKNPFVIYFGKRLISYIVLAILLFILLSGNITIFTDMALKLVQGILDLIQGI